MGLHGEPGVARGKMMSADELVEKMMAQILSDLPFRTGDEVCLLINNLGATTMMELLLVNKKVRSILKKEIINVMIL
jgi:dihydroxyacetone kinase-like protein